MEQYITLNSKQYAYTLKRHASARNMTLKISGQGKIFVVVPRRVPLSLIEKFIYANADWVIANTDSKSEEITLSNDKKKAMYKANKAHALEYIESRLVFFNSFYKLKYKTVVIKDQKNLWGSCSHNGILNFNYRLIFLPTDLSDYIIVHELCHLKEFNHSQAFWDLVSLTIPNYKEIKKTLRVYEKGLYLG